MDPAPRDTWGPDPPIEYLVRWKGYEEKDDTWETEGTLSKAQDALKEFQVRNFTEIVMFMQSALGDEKQRFSNLMESHEDVQRRSRGYSNGFNWIRNENLLLREKIAEVKYFVHSAMLKGGYADALISIQDQPEVPVCTAAKMSPNQRAEIFEQSFEGDMCACAVCLRSKLTLKDVMEQNKAMRLELGRQHARPLEFARRGVPGLSFVARGTREETPLSPP